MAEMLRIAVALLQSASKALDYDWQPLLAFLLASSVVPLRRLALSIALIVLPHACSKQHTPMANVVTAIVGPK
eukprot:1493781-Amphidinium_carterae.1